MIPPSPIYLPHRMHSPAFQLRYTWTGWPSTRMLFDEPQADFWRQLDERWESDGIRRLEYCWSAERIMLTCSVKPTVSPLLFTARIKGRLQHALRKAICQVSFRRKVAFRTIGDNCRRRIQSYLANQVRREAFVDPKYSRMMNRFTVLDPEVHLQDPTVTNSGRYWYNLHLVLVTRSRMRFTDEDSLEKLSQGCVAIAARKGHRLSIRAVMPDHLHLAVRGNLEQSPDEIARGFMNNLAYAFGQNPIWQPSYYVGSFGEYDMNPVRRES